MKLLKYSEKRPNLGDAIQTISLKKFLEKRSIYVDDYDDRSSMTDNAIVNGWHRHSNELLPRQAKYIGIHTDLQHLLNIDTTKKNVIIGCRDPYTLNETSKVKGLKGILSYCSSCTLELYNGFRSGVLHKYHGEKEVIDNASWDLQIKAAEELLNKLKTAELVYTDRLHIVLPCISFGTPVILNPRKYKLERYSLFNIPEYPGHKKPIELKSGLKYRFEEKFKEAFDLIFS
jgi:exopolysaccharide biosynthesis predicted pyruvyltransferase EpsI